MNNQVFKYNDSDICFQSEGDSVMINATDMAKPFDKRPGKWLELPSTLEFLESLRAIRKSDRLIETVNGVGTWMHEDVAIEFARWLSPAFAIWCNDRIKELIKHGLTATPDTIEKILADPASAIKMLTVLQNERIRNRQLQSENLIKERRLALQEHEIQKAAPKVEYYDSVLQAEGLIPANVIAKELGMSAVSLNRILHQKGIIYRSGDTWVLYNKYQNRGFTKTKTYTYTDRNDKTATAIHTYFTEKGREFIHSLFKAEKRA